MSAPFQAMRQPPGSRSGKASSTRSGEWRHGPRGHGRPSAAVAAVGGERLGADRGGLDRGREPGGRGDGRQEARLLGDRFEEQRPGGRVGSRERDARVAAARPEVDPAVGATLPEDGQPGQAVHDVCERHGGRVADGGQVDRRRPGQEQASVTVDGGASRRRQRQGEVGQAGVEGVVEGRREGWGVRKARRERLARSVHDTPPVVRVPPVRAAPLPASASARTVSSISVFRGRFGSRPGLPVPLADRVTLASAPVRMPDGRGREGPASTGLSTNRPRVRGFVDNRPGQAERLELRTGRPSVRRTTSMTSST